MTLLQRIVYWITSRLLEPVIRRRVGFVDGLEHVPADGPVVLVSNHSSFFDHFLLAAAVAGRRSGRMYFLTKQESFASPLRRLWFRSVGAIPVDREQPKPDTLREIQQVLAAGGVLCVYPEGTRGSGWPLLPFKTGAVRFALSARAPIVPAGIWGAQDILPKGKLLPRRARARILFGSPLEVPRGLARAQVVDAVTAAAEETVAELVTSAKSIDPKFRAEAARRTAQLAEGEIEHALERGDEQVDAAALARASWLLELARVNHDGDDHAEIQRLRIRGLKAMHQSPPAALRSAWPIRRRAERVLARDGGNAMAHYLVGRWHLRMPRPFGGRRQLAVEQFALATEHACGDTRFGMGLAEALIATGRPDDAKIALRDVITGSGASEREARRVERAQTLLLELESGGTRPAGAGVRRAPSLTRVARRHPRAVVAAWLLVLAAAAPFALQVNGALKAGGFTDPNGPAAKASATLAHAFGDDTDALFVVLHGQHDVRAALPSALRAIERVPGLRQIRTYQVNPQWLSRDHRTTLVEAILNLNETAAINQVAPLRARLATALHDRGAAAQVTGSPALDHDLNVQSQDDVERAEMIALPILLIVLLLVFQSFAAVGLSLSIAVIAIVITNAIGLFVARATGVSILFSNAVSMIGLAVGVDYGLFILKRFREERAAGATVDHAVDRAMASAGRSVMLSGFAVLAALSTLLIPGVMVLSSIVLGAGVVTCIALALTMTFLPAMLTLFGARLSRPTSRFKLRRKAPAGGLQSVLAKLYRRPGILLVVVAIGTAALAYPLAGLRLQVPVASASILPSNDEARAALTRLQHDLGTRNLFPIEVVLSAPKSVSERELVATVATVSKVAARDPRVASVVSVTDVAPAAVLDRALAGGPVALPARVRAALRAVWTTGPAGTQTRVLITPSVGPDTLSAHRLVAALRERLPALVHAPIRLGLTGATAEGADFDHVLMGAFPLIVAAVALVTLILLALAFGSITLPLIALALNTIVLTASMGVLVRLFQPSAGQSINSITPVLLFAVTFGLSMDYMVIMLSRIRESYRTDGDHRKAVIEGVGRTALMVNGAAAIMVAVFVSFATAQISIVRELGVGLAVAITLDAVVIRLLVMPAALLLFGPRVWGRQRRAPAEPAVLGADEPIEAAPAEVAGDEAREPVLA